MEFYAIILHYKASWILYIHLNMCHPIKKNTEQRRSSLQSQLYRVQYFANSPNTIYDFLEFGQPVNHLVLNSNSSVSICFLRIQIIIELFMRIQYTQYRSGQRVV